MLKGIPKIIPPDLLKALAEMGHTDTICIGDANFPGNSHSQRIVRMDGHSGTEILDAILQLFPLDSYVEKPATLMAKVAGDPVETPIWDEYKAITANYDKRGADCFRAIDKWEFYEQSKACYVTVMSGESALYANIILQKGVL